MLCLSLEGGGGRHVGGCGRREGLMRGYGRIVAGQALEIAFSEPPRHGPSLLKRIERPLVERLGGGRERRPAYVAFVLCEGRGRDGVCRGAIRTRRRTKTAEDLDRELDVFMKEDVEMA